MLFFGGILQFSKKYRASRGFNGRFQNFAMMIGSWTASFFLQVNNCYSRLGKSGFSEKSSKKRVKDCS
jgi:hypothetical protein